MGLKEIGITDALAGLVAEHLSGPALAETWCQRVLFLGEGVGWGAIGCGYWRLCVLCGPRGTSVHFFSCSVTR